MPVEQKQELDSLFTATYEELRRLAAHLRRDEASQTLNPTALVNEVYLKLSETLRLRPESTLHFKRLAARAMRQVLIEAARRRGAVKRGGGVDLVTFDGLDRPGEHRAADLLALDSALERLAELSPRQAQIVELRFYGGMEMGEIAILLDLSPSTVLRDWRAARAWLAAQLVD
jgi:RNA polymerase sigma factor (TIGR02999 family)